MRKLLGYVESWQRMNLAPLIKGLEAPAPKSIGSILASYPKRFRAELQAVVESMIDLAATAGSNGIKQLPEVATGMTTQELIDWLVAQHYDALHNIHQESTPINLRADLEFIATQIVGKVSKGFEESVDGLIARSKATQEVSSAQA
ncbi:hypothetical protein KI809_18405 [Geobacter pelophilus]|uniref:Uncharacterized protein n=1 Tax=Geoanaerobacter pelophilus TaxID=60036 RepID=A0AAW4L801_9BACT|nr:hypothetical protein [Geoanaerobacter pelophilus]MBT0666287.1 hypothetical protein [Geoanaerobacter pelophilus]